MWISIVSDAHIPFVRDYFEGLGELTLVNGLDIEAVTLADCDALLVRSVSRIDADLLSGTRVRFVASATAGTDHVDTDYLRHRGIHFANAPGGNAESVVEFVLAAIFHTAAAHAAPLLDFVIGVVGCGAVGSRLARRCRQLGFHVLCNDPPLSRESDESGPSEGYVSLDELLCRSDLITLHVPLTHKGQDATANLIGGREFEKLKHGAWIVNTSRGGVIDEKALIGRFDQGRLGPLITDVWNGEPAVETGLVNRTRISTPHIAGYSIDAKRTCTRMIAEQFVSFFGKSEVRVDTADAQRFELQAPEVNVQDNPVAFIHHLIKQMYAIEEDDRRFRVAMNRSDEERMAEFRRLRRQYPIRYSFSRFDLKVANLPADWIARLEEGLGISVVQ